MTRLTINYPEDEKEFYTTLYGPLPDINNIDEAGYHCMKNDIPFSIVTVHQVDNEGTEDEEHASMSLEAVFLGNMKDIISEQN